MCNFHLVLGSWGRHLHLGRICQLERHYAECWALRSRRGPLAERLWQRGDYTPWSMLFPLESVLGRSLSWGWRLRSGRLAGGLELPNFLVLFLSWRTYGNARFCLPFLLRLKAVRCEGGRFFSLEESSLSATLVNDLASCQHWIWSCITTTCRKEI